MERGVKCGARDKSMAEVLREWLLVINGRFYGSKL